MKNSTLVKDVTYESLERDEYGFDEIATLLETTRGRVYYNVSKFNIPRFKRGGKHVLTRENIVYLVKCINAYIDDTIFTKSTRLYPKRRRNGNYKKYYRPVEVMYLLKISEDELKRLEDMKILKFEIFAKSGVGKLGGYYIPTVNAFAERIGKKIED